MRATSDFLAIDLGAESGRGVIGRFDGERLTLEEVHRFPNGATRMIDTLYWDLPHLFGGVKAAIAKALSESDSVESLGIDTWGVDFGLVGRGNALLGHPVHYRDARTDGMLEKAFKIVSPERIHEITGVQFLSINTLYQLLAMRLQGSPILDVAETLLMVPDLFAWLLTGRKVGERTDASTTQLYDPNTRNWSDELCESFNLPRRIFPELVDPGTIIGPLLPSVIDEIGCGKGLTVIAPATHDTASAVAAVPAPGEPTMPPEWCFLSSGTWSLLGVETTVPVINESTLKYNFTNEGGVAGTTRLLKNIMGLWLVQECRRTWSRRGREFSYDELIAMAAASRPFGSTVDPDDPLFLAPGDMPSRIADFCVRTGQKPPEDEGSFVRCALESLALKYHWTIERLEGMLGTKIRAIHVVGGGSRNALLCQFTADACGRPVFAGPVEATAAGNVLIQALARGLVSSLGELRSVVARSFPPTRFEPRDHSAWREATERFEYMVERKG